MPSPSSTVLLATHGSLRAIRAAGSLWRGDERSRAAGPPSAAAFSPNGAALAICADPKTLLVLACTEGGEPDFRTVLEVNFPKRLSCVTFTADSSTVLVADRFGDVHSFPVDEALASKETLPIITVDEDTAPLMGHFALITSLAATPSTIASCDRECRVRLSRYPNAYDIQHFCFGHTAFVTRLAWTAGGMLLSGAGDGTVRMWDGRGEEVGVVKITGGGEVDGVVVGLEVSPVNDELAVVFAHGVSEVFVLGIGERELKIVGKFRLSGRQVGGVVSGIGFGKDGGVLVSVKDLPVLMEYKVRRGVDGEFSSEAGVEVCEVPSSEEELQPKPSGVRSGESRESTPGEWLSSLRKLAFDPGWKGKGKRRRQFGEIDEDEVDIGVVKEPKATRV